MSLHNQNKVFGELYEVPMDSLAILDDFEDFEPGRHDNLYERVEVTVKNNNQEWNAFVYIGNQPNMLRNEIVGCNWRDYQKK